MHQALKWALSLLGGGYFPIGKPTDFASLQNRFTDEENRELFSLLSLRCIYSTDDSLCDTYRDELAKLFEDPSIRQKRALLTLRSIDYSKPPSFDQPAIKSDFLQPLTLLIEALYLYWKNPFADQGKGIPNTLDAINQLSDYFSLEGLTLLKKVVSGLYLMRLRYDAEHYQARVADTQLQFEIQPKEKKLLQIAHYLVILPIYQQTRNTIGNGIHLLITQEMIRLMQTEDDVDKTIESYKFFLSDYISKTPKDLKDHYLTLSQRRRLEPLRQAFLDTLTTSINPDLFKELKAMPNRDGYRQQFSINLEDLDSRIEAITQAAAPDPSTTVVEIQRPSGKTSFLKPNLASEILYAPQTEAQHLDAISTTKRPSSGEILQFQTSGKNATSSLTRLSSQTRVPRFNHLFSPTK